MQQVRDVIARSKNQPVELVTINVPDPGPGEVVVKVEACGVCHTDLHYREGGINDDFPFLLGHEAAGVVEAVGPDVTAVAPGDFVVLNWRAVCGQCRACKRGDLHYCFNTHNASQKMTLEDGTELSPALGIGAFAEKTLLPVRYGCRWESTRREDDGSLTLVTTDGEYRCRAAVFALGVTEPWKSDIAGIEHVPHYVETDEPRTYAGKRVVVIGKRNSGFEIADGLLPWASQVLLVSPRPVQTSVLALASVRVRHASAPPITAQVAIARGSVRAWSLLAASRRGSGRRR